MADVLRDFFEDTEAVTVDKGEVVYSSDDSKAAVFYIKEGFIKSYKITGAGDYNILNFYGPDSVFPLNPTLRGGAEVTLFRIQGTIYFETITDCVVHKRSRADFFKLIDSDPSIYQDVTYRLIQNYEIYLSRSDSQQFKLAGDRVLYHLLILADRYGKPVRKDLVLQMPLTHQDLSDSLGMARETVSRELEKLRKKGYIKTQNKQIILRDIGSLNKLLETE